MQEVLVPQPALRLASDHALLAVAVAAREQVPGAAEVLAQVLRDEAALGEDELPTGSLLAARCWVGRGQGDAHDGRLAERVHLVQLGRREHVAGAPEHLDLVGHAELLEQPDEALGARVVEPEGGNV